MASLLTCSYVSVYFWLPGSLYISDVPMCIFIHCFFLGLVSIWKLWFGTEKGRGHLIDSLLDRQIKLSPRIANYISYFVVYLVDSPVMSVGKRKTNIYAATDCKRARSYWNSNMKLLGNGDSTRRRKIDWKPDLSLLTIFKLRKSLLSYRRFTVLSDQTMGQLLHCDLISLVLIQTVMAQSKLWWPQLQSIL